MKKDWSDFLNSRKEAAHDFKNVITDSIAVLERSLAVTTLKLKALNKSGFVDAWAKGFVLFIKGIIDFIINRNIRTLAVISSESISLIHTEELSDEEITHRFCTEAIIRNVNAGETAESVVKSLETDITQTKIFVSVRDLRSMIRGGGVSKPKGMNARALGLNPVISMDKNGKSLLFGKTFSQAASLNKIYSHIRKISGGKSVCN